MLSSKCQVCGSKKSRFRNIYHDMAYVDFKGFPRTTTSDKILCSKALNIAKNPKHNCYQ